MQAQETHGFLDGRLRLRQGRGGHRAGTDAVLLAACTPPEQSGLILDIGAGAGAVGLMAALRAPAATVGLVEIDAATAALAAQNVAENALTDRVSVFAADVAAPKSRRAAGLRDEQAALVLTNPPFYDPRGALALLAPGGVFVMIHRADALAECLAAVAGRLGAVSVRPVHVRAAEPAIRILLRGVKGSKAPLSILPPLVVQDA